MKWNPVVSQFGLSRVGSASFTRSITKLARATAQTAPGRGKGCVNSHARKIYVG